MVRISVQKRIIEKILSWFFILLMHLFLISGICQASTTILTSSSPDHTVTTGTEEKIFGTSTSNRITIESGAKAEMINFPGQNSLQIQANLNLFTVSRSGTVVAFQGSDGTVLKIPATTDIQTIEFYDQGPLTLSIHNGQVMLDDQVITSTPVYLGNPELSVSPSSRNVDSESGTTTFSVSNAGVNIMVWIAEVTSGSDWLTISSGESGSDAGTITCQYEAYTETEPRTGVIRITATDATGSPMDVTVTQQAQILCAYSISPTSGSFSADGESKSVSVTTSNSSCTWSTSGSPDWLTLSPASGTGSGTVTVTAAENTGASRSGTIIIAGESYEISQDEAYSMENCGAYVAPGVWHEFDCYNLAAIGKLTGANPFIPSWELIGGYWQWGRKGPDPDEEDWYNTNTPHFAHGPTGNLAGDANSGQIDGWDSNDAPDGSWSDSNKTVNDPCPDGFKVPSKSHWEGVLDNNPQSTIGTWNSDYYGSARFFGENLMLPAAGFRDSIFSGVLTSRNSNSNYWSSSPAGIYSAWYLFFDNEDAYTSIYFFYRTDGFSVRCISE